MLSPVPCPSLAGVASSLCVATDGVDDEAGASSSPAQDTLVELMLVVSGVTFSIHAIMLSSSSP